MRTHWLHSDGMSAPRHQGINGSPFEMGLLWGNQQAEMARQTFLLEHIATGMDRLPDRLAQRLSGRNARTLWWKPFMDFLRVAVPASAVGALLITRLLAPEIFTEVVGLVKSVP